jgi:hypothetical protein
VSMLTGWKKNRNTRTSRVVCGCEFNVALRGDSGRDDFAKQFC